jgi:hypothetical protein
MKMRANVSLGIASGVGHPGNENTSASFGFQFQNAINRLQATYVRVFNWPLIDIKLWNEIHCSEIHSSDP